MAVRWYHHLFEIAIQPRSHQEIAIVLVVSCIRIVPRASVYIVERRGTYVGTWETGLHIKAPFIDRVVAHVPLKKQTVYSRQLVMSKDNIAMLIDTIVFYQITDPKQFVYGMNNPIKEIKRLTTVAVHKIVGELEVDQALVSRFDIENKVCSSLDITTNSWGIKVKCVSHDILFLKIWGVSKWFYKKHCSKMLRKYLA